MKILIWGAGGNGKVFVEYLKKYSKHQIVGMIDENPELGMPPEKIKQFTFDLLVITNQRSNDRRIIKSKIKDLGVDENKVVFLVEDESLKEKVFSRINRIDEEKDGRVRFLKAFSKYVYNEGIEGNAAECGVNLGEFAYYVNKFFDRKLWLFDTFKGFVESDLEEERKLGDNNFLESSFNKEECFKVTSVDIVKKRMLHPERCEFCVGYFPESAQDVDDTFCFVNLDMDLYKPMLAGLMFFYPKMVHGGVILMHDYFSSELSGVKRAVVDYEKITGNNLHKIPIGDDSSIAIVK